MEFNFGPTYPELSTRPLFEYETETCGASTSRTNTSQGRDFDLLTFKNDGFSDFELDLSCLSNPPSPTTSSTPLVSEPALNHLPTSNAPSSFPISSPSPERISREFSLRRLSIEKPSPLLRNTLPIKKYVGRGTPIDRNRRVEWGGDKSDGVAEDGMLFSSNPARAYSVDGHNYHHRRSISSEWQTVPAPRALSPLHMNLDSSLENQQTTYHEPLPESSKIQIQVDSNPNEWDSVMQTVLGSSGTPLSTVSTVADQSDSRPLPAPQPLHPGQFRRDSQGPLPGVPLHPNGLDIVLRLNNALDLGLSVEREMNFFDLGLIPDSGRDSPSVYSSAQETAHPSRAPSIQVDLGELEAEHDGGQEGQHEHEHEQEQEQESDQDQDDQGSDEGSGSLTAEGPPVIPFEPKPVRVHWWSNAWQTIRRVPVILRSYRSKM